MRGQYESHVDVDDVSVGQEYVGQVTGYHYVVTFVGADTVEFENQHTGETEEYTFERVQEALNVPTLRLVS